MTPSPPSTNMDNYLSQQESQKEAVEVSNIVKS
jgi:hypothetical protein